MTIKTTRRSVSPFGGLETESRPIDVFSEAGFAMDDVEVLWDAPSGDTLSLEKFCQAVAAKKTELEEKKIFERIHAGMLAFFDRKTELFLFDHNGGVLFEKERDTLIGRYFAPVADHNAGLLSEFVSHWTSTENIDQLLHFLDFCRGSKNTTFEHYLLFAHPAFARVLRNKSFLDTLINKAAPLLKRATFQEWGREVKTALGLS